MSKVYVIFEAYLASNWSDIKAGKEVIVEVQYLETAMPLLVRARIARNREDLPQGDELRARNDDGVWKKEEPWAIEILEELDPDEVSINIQPSTARPAW